MKTRRFKIIAFVLSVLMLTACGHIWETPNLETYEPGEESDENSAEESSKAGAENIVSLSDDLKASVCDALISRYGTDYSQADYVIPAFSILNVNDQAPDDIKLWGDFWRFAYRLERDTLVSVAGEDVSGCMHLNEQNGVYQFIGIEVPTSGSSNEETAKDIFGDSYQTLLKLREDYQKQEEARAQLIADYAAAYGIEASNYTDYSWEPTELPSPSPDKDNIFIYMLLAAGAEYDDRDVVVSPATEETSVMEEAPVTEEAAAGSYTVKHGDSLGSIARRYGISTLELAEMNRDVILRCAREQGVKSEDLMKCANYIYPGEQLTVPAD